MAEPRPLPLFEWSDRRNQRRVVRRRRALRLALLGVMLAPLIGVTVRPPAPRLMWNASASAPVGLYRITPGLPVRRDDLVLVWLPPAARALAARRHYLPANVPALKQVAGVAGDTICASGPTIWRNGRAVATRRPADRLGRALPAWGGCVRLGADDLFLLNRAAPDSFDGRYFGAVGRRSIIGQARLLWPR